MLEQAMKKIPQCWYFHLKSYFESQKFNLLRQFLQQEKHQNKIVYPHEGCIFRAFELTPFDDVKVVLLGQDPYHQPEQAEGLSFSVTNNLSPPPSLKNIFKELNNDLSIDRSGNNSLSAWARQGVLLLNASLTVEQSKPGSHSAIGWEHFTNLVISSLSRHKKFVIFVLWGKNAASKKRLIDTNRHLIIESSHPSPLAAYRGFFGSRPFSKINSALNSYGLEPIDWT